MMVSNDAVIIAQISELSAKIDAKFAVVDGQLVELKKQNEELRTEVRVINAKLTGIENRIDDMKFFTSLTFGVLAVIVAFVALIPAISKIISVFQKPTLTAEQVREIVKSMLTSENVAR